MALGNYLDYGSSSGSDSEREKPVSKRAKTVFYVPKKVAEEEFKSKLLPENQGLLNILPKPTNSLAETSANNSSNINLASAAAFAFRPRTVGGGGRTGTAATRVNAEDADDADGGADVEGGDGADREEKDEVEHVEEEETFDFFSLAGPKEEILLPSAGPKQGPAKPDHLKATASQEQVASSADPAKKAPFVFRPIQKPVPSPLLDPDVISIKDSKLFSKSSAKVQAISHSDLLGDNESRARQRQVQESVKETRHLIDDPFSKLEGSYVASNASTRTNSIMQMAYKAKDEYFNRVERKAEQKAVKKMVRQKYGF